jgi:protein SCO1/2
MNTCLASSIALGLVLVLRAGPVTTSVVPHLPPCCRAAPATNAPSDRSLYLLESDWTSDVGRKVKLGVLRGRQQVLAMVFTRCESACPIIVDDLLRIQRTLAPELRDQVDFVLVSFDPERDTPDVLRAYRQQMHLAADHWTLLTGRPDDVRELAVLLGVNYQRDARGQFAHSNVITVLNAEGEIIHRQVGLGQGPAETVAALAATSPAKAGR